MKSAATCTLGGHLVIIDSFGSPSDTDSVKALVDKTETYYAHGTGGWLAILADQGATAATTTLQMQLTNDAGGLTKQALDHSALAPASLDAQKTILAQVAADLHGQVIRVPG